MEFTDSFKNEVNQNKNNIHYNFEHFDDLLKVFNAIFGDVFEDTDEDTEVQTEQKPELKPLPERPNNDITEKHKNEVTHLVEEYLNTMVKPFCELDDKAFLNKKIELIDFAAWILNK